MSGQGDLSGAATADVVSTNGAYSAYRPHSLRDALSEVGSSLEPSGTPSEEDYDDLTAAPEAIITRRRPAVELDPHGDRAAASRANVTVVSRDDASLEDLVAASAVASALSRPKRPLTIIAKDDKEMQEIMRHGLERVHDPAAADKRRKKFSDLVFTRKFSAFDMRNEHAANSPFHGFFTLFWMTTALFMLKIGAENYRRFGSPLGQNEIMKVMFDRDIAVLLFADGVMCGSTAVSWLLQRAILADYLDWDRSGWILQNVWQTLYMAAVVGLPIIRNWPWTHTVFFVMHGLVMLMKQHSYAFYNGHLSSAFKKRTQLLLKLKQLENIEPTQAPSPTLPHVSAISTSHLSQIPSAHERKERHLSTSREKSMADIDKVARAVESGEPLDELQVAVFERLLRWEMDALTDELKGKSASPARAYPRTLTLANHYEFNVLPTLVYELEYPRADAIDWRYAVEKMAACFGIIFVMIMVSQAFILPVVLEAVRLKDAGVPLAARFRRFPWMLLDLVFPFLMEYLMAWYLIWETVLNFIAEVTYFADRNFYDAWWNSVSWDQFARDWNRPVHNFLLRHVYHSSISAMKVNKHTATVITFFLSACVHELLMACIFKKLRGYLLISQMIQLPVRSEAIVSTGRPCVHILICACSS